jgi:phosphotransacetylase
MNRDTLFALQNNIILNNNQPTKSKTKKQNKNDATEAKQILNDLIENINETNNKKLLKQYLNSIIELMKDKYSYENDETNDDIF